MTVLLTVLSLLLVGWIGLSWFIVINWIFKPETKKCFRRYHEREKREKWKFFVHISALFGLLYIFAAGIESFLFFIPESWGGFDENGEFVTMRWSLAFFLGFVAALKFMSLLEEHGKLRAQNKQLSIELEVREQLDSLRSLASVEREKEISRIKATVTELAEFSADSYEDRVQREVLEEVLEKIEQDATA